MRLSKPLQHQCWIVLAASVVFFIDLGATGLWELDEPLYASCAREMLQRGDWIVPMYNGQIFFDKPPLMFWLMLGGFKLFGITEFAARFWSAVLGIGTALGTYHLGRILFRAQVGFWAGLIMASTLIFTVSARAATADSALVFFTTMSLLLFAISGVVRKTSSPQAESLEILAQFREAGTSPEGALANSQGRGPLEQESNLDPDSPAGAAVVTPAACCRPFGALSGSLGSVPRGLRPWLFATAVSRLEAGVLVLSYACMGLAVLAKGPVGALLPLTTIGLFLMMVGRAESAENPSKSGSRRRLGARIADLLRVFAPANIFRAAWQMQPVTAIVVLAVVALPWYVWVGLRTDGEWLKQFFTKFNVGPFLAPSLGHHGPFYYHFLVILVGFFPWSVFLGSAIVAAVRRTGEHHPWRAGYVLLACWTGVFFAFWSICSTKLPHYVLPAYPALALLTACFLDDWLEAPARIRRWWLRIALGILPIVGIAMLVLLPMAAAKYLPGEEIIGLLGLILVLGGGLCLVCLERGRQRQMLTTFAVTSVVFVTGFFGFAAVRVDRHQHAKPLAAAIRQDSSLPPQIAAYRFLQACMVYYTGGPVAELEDAAALRQFLQQAQQPYIFTTDAYQPEIEQAFPGEFRVLSRRPRFLGKGEVLVLARRENRDPPHTAGAPDSRR